MTTRASPCLGRIAVVVMIVVAATVSIAFADGPFAEGALEIRGARLTIYSDSLTNDADQVVNVGERAVVRTCYGGGPEVCGGASAGDLGTTGLEVHAELQGPELPTAVPLATVPGGTFILPSFQQEGDYLLENIRLVDADSGAVLESANPPLAVIHVRRILLASATVSTLSLADLEARGIAISQENFQAFDFSVGFAFGSEIVTIDLPVLYQGGGEVQVLDEPTVHLDGLPPDVAHVVDRWQPPSVVPFSLEIPEVDPLAVGEEPYEPITFPIFGAIVMPGSVSFLNQFFEATMIVANGAPAGTAVDLDNLEASIKLPNGNVLRVAETDPPVAPGQQVPMTGANGSHVIGPGEQASASWTIEGLVAGTHALAMEVTGELLRPGKATVPVTTRAQAAVEVVDARFHLVFSHPDVVREGSPYTLYVTVSNLSRATQNLVSVEIRDQHITGAHKADAADDFVRTIESLEPGQSETVEYRLVADVTGQVVGGTFESSSSSGSGAIQLYTGVGELGIPLSPATLRLPRFTERLATPYIWTDDYLSAVSRYLGLAYSLAVAPAGMAPAGLPGVIRSDVEARAVDLGYAGQRTFLGEELLESLEVLLLDQLGNRQPLEEIDELRRLTDKGLAMSAELANLLRHEQEERGLDAVDLFDHFAETTSYTDPYAAALLLPGIGGEPPLLELDRLTEGGWTSLAGTSEDGERQRSLPFGEIFAIKTSAAGSQTSPLAVVGSVPPGERHELRLRNPTDSMAAGRLLVLVADDAAGGLRKLDFGIVTVPPHAVYAVTVGSDVRDPSDGGFELHDVATGQPVAGLSVSSEAVPLPPFRVIGARQDYLIGAVGRSGPNRYGQGVSYLFNRPPDQASAENASSYLIRSTFDDGNTLHVAEKGGRQAFLQPSGRVVNVRFSSPISALWDSAIDEPLVEHADLSDAGSITDEWGNPLGEAIPPPMVEYPPQHLGGLVGGKVLRGTGAPAAGTTVQLIRPRLIDTVSGFKTVLDLVGAVTTGDDGAFYFDFVEQPHPDRGVQDQFILRAIVPAGADPATEPAAEEEVSSTIRLQNKLTTINIALLGRGTVTGELVYLDTGEPVPGGTVTVASTLFNDTATVAVATDGSFEVPAMPVGPLTVTGRDTEGRVVYATVGLERPGDVVHVVLELLRTQPPGLGTVVGTVLRQDEGTPAPPPEPAAGATVEVSAGGASLGRVETDAFGHFRFENVPAGQVTVQAADWRISRTSVLTDLTLAADETAEVTLTIPTAATRSVSGSVLFYDPAANRQVPVEGAAVFISGPGVFAYTGADGAYRIEGVPVQAAGSSSYTVSAIDLERELEGNVELPPILAASPEVIAAQPIVLREMRGGIDGVVLDPLGRPFGGAGVVAVVGGTPFAEATARFDGSFSFDDLPLGEWEIVAHSEDGLEEGRVGYFGKSARTKIVFGGHRPFASVQMVGSGVVDLQVSSGQGSSVWAEVYYRPTYFSDAAKDIMVKGVAIETETDPNGVLQLVLPVGSFEITVFSPFHGARTVKGSIEWAGQVKNVDIVFDGSSTVTGRLVDVDGVTPIPDFEVELRTKTLQPQTQRTDAEGRFRFELVPRGSLEVRADGTVGSVDRVGVANGFIASGGQTLDLLVQMKAQGTVEGRVFERVGDGTVPLANSEVYVVEESFPFRVLPAWGSWYPTDADGRYRVSHVSAGSVRVVARDRAQVDRRGSVKGVIGNDWQVVEMPDLVLESSVGSVTVTVRDPDTGAPLPDTQVRIREPRGYVNELTVADQEGRAVFDALPLWGYFVTAFHAPSGRSGRLDGLVLSEPGQQLERTLYVDRRGAVGGTLFDDPSKLQPVAGGTVQLHGQTAGAPMTALDTTSGRPEDLGRFQFLGIPEGDFHLTAGVAGSPRRAGAQVALTATAPVADVDLVLEPAGDVAFRVYERLSSGLDEIDPALTPTGVRLEQPPVYDFTRLTPQVAAPGHAYLYPDVLLERSGTISAQELGGEQRSARVATPNFAGGVPLEGSGSEADPYRIVLGPKGVVRVTVLDADAQPVAGADVTVTSSGGGRFPSVTGADGTVSFAAVPAGELDVSASAPALGVGGRSSAVLRYDDDVIDVTVTLAAAVSAHGVVYQPLPGDVYSGDPSTLQPQAEAIVVFSYGGRTLSMVTGGDGAYRFDALPEGATFTVFAQSQDGQAIASTGGTLLGPNGHDNEIPPLILDGGPPQIRAIAPPPGMEEVSRTAVVEILFSEPLDGAVLPSGQPTTPFFELRGPDGPADGIWRSALDDDGRQVVRFEPSAPYVNRSVYSLRITGGPQGVRDRSGRPLTASGDVGSNFTTSDSVGPAVVATLPTLERPVEGGAPVRFDFNEALSATDEQLDGDGLGDAAALSWGQDDGAGGVAWQPLPITLFLTRNDYSLTIDPVEGLELTDDSLLRRVEIAGLEDSQGNVMAPYERDYRIRDGNPPVIDELPPPPDAPDGSLLPGRAYTVTPVLSGIDHFPLDPPDGDLDRVEYFFTDPGSGGGAAQPGFVAAAPPYAFSFVAAYSGNGVDPRPFPVWARAVDTSDNRSAVVDLAMEVLANQPPSISSVTAGAVAPVAGVFYSGSVIRATIAGLADPDDAELGLSVELWREGVGTIAVAPTRSVQRPGSGDWADLEPPTAELEIPPDTAEGAVLYLRARATDASAASATAESERFAVADDQGAPTIDGIIARSTADGEPRSLFYIGQELVIELTARDAETGVAAVEVSIDRSDIFPSPLTATRVAGDLYRTEVLTVPVDAFTETTPITATATASDRGGNTATDTYAFEVAPEPDPTAPTVEWLTPWEGAEWPAGHTSTLAPGMGTALLVRIHARDTNVDGNSDPVPGTIVEVTLRGPVADGSGGVMLTDTPVAATIVAGSEAPGEADYQLVWPVPDGVAEGAEIPFEARVVDSGGLEVVSAVRMRAVPYRAVYEGVETAVLGDDPILAAGGVEEGGLFLLDGATLSLYPPSAGGARAFDSLFLYTGGSGEGTGLTVRPSVLTVPGITSYSSSILFHPLELEIARVLAIGAEARIDVSGKGLLGSLGDDQMVLPGETGAENSAGGSHGGSGWFGNFEYYIQVVRQPSSVYDVVRDPALPGAGGGGDNDDVGGTGGGVVRIDARDATVRLIGDLRSDGEIGVSSAGGGAGGSVLLRAGRLEGSGRLTADGGAAARSWGGGGGGGRIAVLARELGGGFEPERQAQAEGGFNGAYLAGAGTVYVADLESGPIGSLIVANPADEQPGATPLPAIGGASVTAVDPDAGVVTVESVVRGDVTGDALVVEDGAGAVVGTWPITAQERVPGGVELRVEASEAELAALEARISGESLTARSRTRLAEVRASGSVRLAIDDDLVVGAADDPAPRLNDRDALVLADGARAALRGEGPTLELIPNTDPAADVLIGTLVSVNRIATDPLGVFEIVEAWPPTGTVVQRLTSQPLTTEPWPGPYTFQIPVGTPPGETTLEMTVRDVAGRATTARVSWNLVPDEVPPEITIELEPAAEGDVYSAGTWVTITVAAADNVGMDSLSLTFDGVTSEGYSWLQRRWVAPVVAESTPFDITVEARDETGNVATTVRTLTVEPSTDTGAPAVTITCPLDGDGCAPGSPVNVSFSITDDEQIESYALLVDGVQVGDRVAVNQPSLEGSVGWTPPPDALAGESFTLMLEARDFGGNSGFAVVTLTVPEGTILTGDQEIFGDHAGEDLVLGAGTLTAASTLRPDSLTLLNGSVLTSPELEVLEIATAGPVRVVCGAAIDVTGRGYGPEETFPGAEPPSSFVAGGSHLGHGGSGQGRPGETYGSVTRPREHGAGGMSAIFGTRGGGVAVVEANTLELDGAILANGGVSYDGDHRGGAGGSVSITAYSVSGTGRVEADGSSGSGISLGAGGGGAIAVVADTVEPAILETLRATGGEHGQEGGAGTVFLFGPGSNFGDLVVDARGIAGEWTVLPALGGGVAQAGSGGATLVTDRTADIPPYFVGHWVQISVPDETVKGTWRIEAVDGVTLTLEAGADVAEGDLWQGVYRFDSVTVRGRARLRVDDLDDFGELTVAPDSSVILFNREAPTVDLGLVGFSRGNLSSTLVRGEPGAVTDPDQPVRVEVFNVTSEESWRSTANADGSFVVAVGGLCGDRFELVATDTHVHPRATPSLDLGPMPDVVPPRVDTSRVVVSFADRRYLVTGWTNTITDECGLDRVEIVDPARPDAAFPVAVAADGSFGPVAVDAPSGTELVLRAVDVGGNENSRTLEPLPANDGPPVIKTSYISVGTVGGVYSIEDNGFCILEKQLAEKNAGCTQPIGSFDGIGSSRFENRSTPVFGPFEFEALRDCPNCYGFDPVTVDGAVGDEIWLVVEDDHPEWQAAEALVWTLPQIPGAPAVYLNDDNLGWVDGEYRLMLFGGEITDADGPLTLEVGAWRQVGETWLEVVSDSRSMASGETLTVPLPGGSEGDLVLASAVDAAGLKTTVRVGTLPPPVAVTAVFEEAVVSEDENAFEVTLRVRLSRVPLIDITVGYRTVAETAVAGEDYVHTEGVLTFPAGDDNDQRIDVRLLDDASPESDETFRVELLDPVGAELGTASTAEVTILDDDEASATTVVPYSVAVGVSNYLAAPIDVSITGGVASFAEPLPAIVGRGDRLEVEGLGGVFIDHCPDDSTCTVVDALGRPPIDAYGVLVTAAAPAFSSLAEAVQGASDADHLGTSDLVAADRALELVCYGGLEDTTAVTIDGWTTSTDNRIRIVAADASDGHDGSWRHPGRWSGGAYRLEVVDEDGCISSSVGHLTLEGLQLNCENAYGAVHGIQLDGIGGDVEIAEALIHLGPSSSSDGRVGIYARSASEPVSVTVRNSVLWDLGDGSSPDHAGILVADPIITLLAANNTVFGGSYGIRVDSGTVTAVNDMVTASTTGCFDGTFTPESTRNLASDGSAPDPPANASGPVTVVDPAPDLGADFHLRCGVLDQAVTVTHDFEIGSEDELQLVFDGDPETLLRSASINPARVRLEFDDERAVTGTSVVLSHWDSHDWMVAAADTVEDLDGQTGSYRELVPWRAADNREIIWDGVTFDSPEAFRVIELTVQRNGGDDNVHINEWTLDGLNPACGQGVDLSAHPQHPFASDVDSVARVAPWDIGADQSSELEVGFADGPWEWWEAEGAARLQVVLSEPAPAEVRVRYRTEELSALEGEDFQPATGELIFNPGELSKIIEVELNDDGPNGDDGRSFGVVLFDAVGARLANEWWEITLREGAAPARVSLAQTVMQTTEGDGTVAVGVVLSAAQPADVSGTWDAVDGSAHIGVDYRGMWYEDGAPWASYTIPAGQTSATFEYEILDDDVMEGVEGFRIKGGWPNGAAPGVPSAGWVRIIDNDGGAP